MGLLSDAITAVTKLFQGIPRISITKRFTWTGYTNSKMPPKYTYFSDEEVAGLDPELCAKLDMARSHSGVPFIITSGLRSSSDNERVMGVESSSHLKGLAVDLRCDNSLDRYKMVASLLGVGFTRLGIYNLHIHADLDISLPNPVIWIGLSH